MPAVASLQPETVLPHYADAGCGDGPRLPSQGVYGEVRFSNLASLDLFIDHDWHDFNFFTKLEGDAHFLNSAANQKNTNSFLCYRQSNPTCRSDKGEALMEIEWDTRHYPERFWASAGDRVWMTGRYIWDCGHPAGYHTEIHPPKAIALTRLEPYVFPGDDSPSLTNQTYVYVHGKSGLKNYSFRNVEGVESVIFNGYKDAAVANENYEFDIPLPPKPTGYSRQPFAQVLELPFGGPPPDLSLDGPRGIVHVKYPLQLSDAAPERRFAARIVAGWRAPISSVRFRQLTVHVEQLQVLKSHNVVSFSDWKLWLNINGQWTRLEGLQGSDNSMPLRVDRLLNLEGLFGRTVPTVKIDRQFRVLVPDTDDASLTIQVSGWVNLYDDLFGAREDLLTTFLRVPSGIPQVLSQLSTSEGRVGLFFRQFSKAESFGVGRHNLRQENHTGELSRGFEQVDGTTDSGFPKSFAETEGDFAIAYTISESP
jgi:hypothetical protein